MPWPVYTERILHHANAGTWTYVVPDERRLILRQAIFTLYAQPPAYVLVTIGGIGILFHDFLATHETVTLDLVQVAYQREQVQLIIQTSGTHSTVTGWLLNDTSGRTGPPLQPATKPGHDPPARPTPSELAERDAAAA